MFSNPRDHFVQHVLPAYRDFFAGRRENESGVNDLVRLAVNAATALYHLREHIAPHPAIADLVARCPDFALVRDMTNASKHHELTKPAVPAAQITKADHISEVRRITLYKDDAGEYSCSQVEVVVTLNDGTQRVVAEILHNAMTMWCKKLDELAVISTKNPEPAPVHDVHVSREDAAKRQSPIRMNAREEFRTAFHLLRFNYDKNASEPVDLTGSQVRFSVYKPVEKVTLAVTVQPGGRDASIEVPLTQEQSEEYTELRDPKDQMALVQRIVQSTPALREALVSTLKRLAEETVAETGAGQSESHPKPPTTPPVS